MEQGDKNSFRQKLSAFLAAQINPQLPTVLPEPCAGRKRAEMPDGLKNDALISLRGVSAAYGDQLIFADLHFEMRQTDHVLLEGPNGCGKSTLLDLIDGDNHKAYGQSVYLFGRRRGSGESVRGIKSRFGA
jgi:molybdate transport system ATP-binding protein